MIIIVATSFLVCWTPFYLVSVISQNQEDSFLRRSNFVFTMLSTHLVGFLNSCVNPFIYCFLSEKFRTSFKNILMNILCRLMLVLCMGRWRCCRYFAKAHAPICNSCALTLMQTPSARIRRMSWRTSAQYKSGTGSFLYGQAQKVSHEQDVKHHHGQKATEAIEMPKLVLKSSLAKDGNVELTFEACEDRDVTSAGDPDLDRPLHSLSTPMHSPPSEAIHEGRNISALENLSSSCSSPVSLTKNRSSTVVNMNGQVNLRAKDDCLCHVGQHGYKCLPNGKVDISRTSH